MYTVMYYRACSIARIGIAIQISDPSDPSDSTEHFILDLDCCHVDEVIQWRSRVTQKGESCTHRARAGRTKSQQENLDPRVCVPQCVQKRFLPTIYAQRSHLDPLGPVNPAPRRGFIGSKSKGSGSGFNQSKGCESSGSGLPTIYAQRSHLDPLGPVNPAPRRGLTGYRVQIQRIRIRIRPIERV